MQSDTGHMQSDMGMQSDAGHAE